MSIKSWWNSLWGVIPEPTLDLKYKLGIERKEGVSEPVYTLAKLFSENPERFKFEYTIYKSAHKLYGGYNDGTEAYCNINIRDSVTEEMFCVECTLNREAVKDHDDFHFYRSFAKHKYYPILGYSVSSKPNWITESEKDYLENILKAISLKGLLGTLRL